MDCYNVCASEFYAAASINPSTAFETFLTAMKEGGFELNPTASRDIMLTIEVDTQTGRLSTRSEAIQNRNEDNELARRIGHNIKEAIAASLRTNPQKLQDALRDDDVIAFSGALGFSPPISEADRSVVLLCINEALVRPSWKDEHWRIAAYGAVIAESRSDFRLARHFLRQVLSLKADDTEIFYNFQLEIANSYAREQRLDTAIEIYQSLLNDQKRTASQDTRAWILHNLGSAYLQLQRIEEGLENLRQAATLRRSLGIADEPARTLGTAASSLQRLNSRAALAIYDEIIACTEIDGSNNSERIIAHCLYDAARIRCIDLKQFDEALKYLVRAEPLLNVVHEDADTLAGCMLLRAICFDGLGDRQAAENARTQRSDFLAKNPYLRSSRLDVLFNDASELGATDLDGLLWEKSLRDFIQKLGDLNGIELIDQLEHLLENLSSRGGTRRYEISALLLNYVADQLLKLEQPDRALPYYMRAIAEHPASFPLRMHLAVCLQKLGRFGDAVKVGIAIARDHPDSHVGFLIAGSQAYKDTNYDLAEQMLREAIARNEKDQVIKDFLEKVSKERTARTLNGLPTGGRLTLDFAPTTPSEFLSYLKMFVMRARLNADSLWKSRSQGRLVQNPENAARALLAQDLIAKCSSSTIYKEAIVAGGRIDLIVNVLGSEFIVELKICGAGYSKTYAEGGFDQLKQYLRERNATRGFLVIFDARAKQNINDAFPTQIDLGDGLVAFCIAVNIRGVEQQG